MQRRTAGDAETPWIAGTFEETTREVRELALGELSLRVEPDPLAITIERRGRRLLDGLELWAADGTVHDHFVQITEGVLAREELLPSLRVAGGRVEAESERSLALAVTLADGSAGRLALALSRDRLVIELEVERRPLRVGARWRTARGEHATGLGARHGTAFDQMGRRVHLGADRRYTGPDCPEEMLEQGGIPQGDYAPVPWLLSSAGYAVWLESAGAGAQFELDAARMSVSARSAAGPLRLHVLTDPSPAARLRSYCRLTGFPAVLPEWGYGHWKSRDVYEHQDDVVDDFEGYLRHSLPLDAIVLDSPWETQYNTWEFNPHQFPDAPGLIARMRAEGVRTVLWVTPWVNLDSSDGQRPPDGESERMHREPAPNYAPAAEAGHFVKEVDGSPFVARWWMGTGSPIDFTSPAAERWWRELAKGALRLGAEGIKADDGEGYYFPDHVRFADGRGGAELAWEYGGLYWESMQRALDEATGGSGVLFGRAGWSGRQRHGVLWGGDQASDFWSLRVLVSATLTAAASGFSNWSHDVGGYLGERLVARCPKELLVRWLQFGCFTPLLQAHGRFPQEAWTYDAETLELYRRFLVLHERLVPYVRAAARTAAGSGLPIVRPLCLVDPGDRRAWGLTDQYAYGPALWVAPVLEVGARERRVELPRGDWIDFWTRERVRGGRELMAAAPLGRIPVWVRSGSIVVTYPAEHVAAGLGDHPEAERPLEATLWGEPALGRAAARLADGTRISWRRGRWSVDRDRDVHFHEI
jgi:alpha-glucosidase (family GH31 glycosyl hydrolase)